MGTFHSLCGELTHTVVDNTNNENTQDFNNISTIQSKVNDPLRKFLQSSNHFSVKTLIDIQKTELPIQSSQKMNKNNSKTIEEEIVSRIRKKTMEYKKEVPEMNYVQLVDEQIQQIAQQKKENIELFNANIDRKQVFKKLKISLSSFIKIIHSNVIDYYQFQQTIGQGSFGKVYRAICRRTKQDRAIKVLKNKIVKKQDASLLSEFNLLSQLDHPNIVKLYQIYYYKSFYYVVMEYCKGGSIVELGLKLQRFSQSLIMNITQQLLSALAYLHQRHIVHRDIKIDNVVFLNVDDPLNLNYHIKIIDFGTAIKKSQFKGQFAGTKCYMAPEVYKRNLHEKSDVWSCGVYLYLLFCGKFPFTGKVQSELEYQIHNKVIAFVQPEWREVSMEARKLILGMLERNIDKRLSAEQALGHPWFKKGHQQSPMNSTSNIEELQKYQRGNNFISVIENYLSLSEISQKERERLAVIFKKIDTNNNGTIDANELMSVYSNHFGVHKEEEVSKILQKIDQNLSGQIDFNEFLVAMYTKKKLFLENALADAFRHFDISRDGYLQKCEIKFLLQGCDREEIQFLLKQLDQDGDQKVSLSEFLHYMRRFS